MFSDDIAEKIKHGSVAVFPSETVYGLMASIYKPEAIEKIYDLKNRDRSKASIILMAEVDDVREFILDEALIQEASNYWPGPNSIVLAVTDSTPQYLHRGLNSLAFRIPDDQQLRDFLKKSGPVIAPSANPEDEKPAHSVEEAEEYFGDRVEIYIDGGKRDSQPSKVIKIDKNGIKELRA